MAKIVHLGKYYFPHSGGIERVTSTLAKGALTFGHETKVVCFGKVKQTVRAQVEGVEVIRCPILFTFFSQAVGTSYLLESFRASRKSDLVHLHYPNLLAVFVILFLSKRIPVIVHWHSDIVDKGLIGKITIPITHILLRRASCIIATSSIYANSSLALRRYIDKVSVIPIGIPDLSSTLFKSEKVNSLKETIQDRSVILSIGRLVPYKGFDVLIEASKFLVSNTIVVIVGDGPLSKQFSRYVKENASDVKVVLTGSLTDSELRYLFKCAKLYCLASNSRAEAFGVVLLEAMTFGLPIVATEIPGSGVQWVNKHGVSGLNVSINNPIELAEACNLIIASKDLRDYLSHGARERFLSEFNEDLFVNRIMEVYMRLLSI